MRKKQYIKEINRYKRKLSKENQERFDIILLKIRYADVSDQDAEEFLHHSLDLFLQAEEEKVPVEQVLNTNDLDAFCRDFIDETKRGYSVWEKFYWQIHHFPLIILIFAGFWEMLAGYLFKDWFQGQMTLSVPVTVSMIVNTLLVLVLAKIILQEKVLLMLDVDDPKISKKVTVFIWLGFCLLTGAFVLSKLFLGQVVFTANFLGFVGVFGGICLLQWFVEGKWNQRGKL